MSTPPPILAATDFSERAHAAVERAAALARQRHRPLELLHVHNEFAWSSLRELLREAPGYDPRPRLAERLREMAADLAARARVAVSSGVVMGRASVAIVARAREIGADLLVLGAHGAGLARELALGGSAIKVLRASPCPVLVARADPARPYRAVVVGTDFSATATRALRAALEWFPDARHRVVHAHGAPEQTALYRLTGAGAEAVARHLLREREAARRNLDAFLADADYLAAGEVEAVLREGHAAGALLEEAADADLLVVGRHGHSALDERLLGSVALNVLHHAPRDVLLVP